MTMAEQLGLEEKDKAEEVIRTVSPIEEVDGFEVRLDDDWAGEPSLYITFIFKPGTRIDETFLRRFATYRMDVSFAILNTSITRFPYTDFRKAA